MRRLFFVSVLIFSSLALLGTSSDPAFGQQLLPGKKKAVDLPVVSTQVPVFRFDQQGEIIPPPITGRPGVILQPGVVQPGFQPGVVPPTFQPGVVQGQPVALAPIVPRDFAKYFKPGPSPARYEVVFRHPCGNQCVMVCFDLPPGCPRVSFCCNTLVFDYGCCKDVVIRFGLCNKVTVTTRL